MCCILHRPKHAQEIPRSYLERIIKINSDGWGASYMKNGVLQVVKSLNMDEAIERVRKLEKENVEFLFHARYTTHGDNIIENCHPYDISNGVLFHNGKIKIFCKNKKFSDTYYYALKVNKFLKRKRTIPTIVNITKKMIGDSRLAFMTNDGEIKKFGEWHEIDGCFYSKKNWKYYYHKDDYKEFSFGGYNSGNSGFKTLDKRRRQASLWPATPGDDDGAFQEILKNCQNGWMLYTQLVKKLDDAELLILAQQYPKLCADYLAKICY